MAPWGLEDQPTECRKVLPISKLRGTRSTERPLWVDEDRCAMSPVTLEQ